MSPLYHNDFIAMNTRCNIVLLGVDDFTGNKVFELLKQETARIESTISRFLPDSAVSALNNRASEQPVPVSNEVFQILKTCYSFFRDTNGAFDITLRPLMEYWNKQEEESQSEQLFEQIRSQTGMEHLELDPHTQTVRFAQHNMEIDLGGFGKGYALKQMNRLLQHHEISQAFISFGESSVLTRGHHPAGNCWKVGVNNYSNPGDSIWEFHLTEGSVSTSANFFITDNGDLRQHQHVIDPVTGIPVKSCRSVSVADPCPVVAEILSTACLVSSEDQIKQIISNRPHTEAVSVDYTHSKPSVKSYGKPREVNIT